MSREGGHTQPSEQGCLQEPCHASERGDSSGKAPIGGRGATALKRGGRLLGAPNCYLARRAGVEMFNSALTNDGPWRGCQALAASSIGATAAEQ
jgi:hypothetical protein